LITVPISQSESAFSPDKLAEIALEAKINSQSTNSVESALELVANEFAQKAAVRVMICGSLYLVGEVLGKNGTPPE